ncbi:MAG: LamG-like jellyroll fold domain-containing protein [Verrucomicrobiota bacterium]
MNLNHKKMSFHQKALIPAALAGLLASTASVMGQVPPEINWPAGYPEWWYDADPAKSMIDVSRLGDSGNWSPILQGQLLHMADIGIQELDEQLGPIGGAGFTINEFKDPNRDSSYSSPAAIGQLKFVASKFYDRFAEIGYQPAHLQLDEGEGDNSPLYPWRDDQTPENLSIALIGQAKNLFAWDISAYVGTDSDSDSLPDYWEWYWFQSLTQTASDDADGDGQDNAEELAEYENPSEAQSLAPVLWLRADQYANGSTVAQWEDYSGLDNHAIQQVVAHQPQYVEQGYFDHPAVNFDGVDDTLEVSLLSGSLTDYTVYLFVRVDDLASHSWALGDRSGNDAFLLSIAVDGSVTVKTDTASQLVSVADTVKANHWHLISFVYNSGVGRLSVNGFVTEQTGMSQLSSWDSLDLGQGGTVAGQIAECLVFDFALTDSQLETVREYLASKTRMSEDSDLDGLLDKWELEQPNSNLATRDAGYQPVSLPTVTIQVPAHNPSL